MWCPFSSGIGEASATLLAQNGANVVLGALRTQKLEKIVGEIRAFGSTVEFFDLANRLAILLRSQYD